MLKITGTTIIPTKTAGVTLHPVVLMVVSGSVAGVVGQVAGYCVTTTPVKENKLGHCYYHRSTPVVCKPHNSSTWWSRLCLLPLK